MKIVCRAKTVLTLELSLLATEAVLASYIAEHGALPPRIAALLGRPASANL